MGLDTTHDCWHGAYSAFNRWRNKLAEVAGYTFYKSEHGFDTVNIDWGNIHSLIGNDLLGKWKRLPVRPDGTTDALIILLAHSDCEGEIQHEFAGPLAERLEQLLPLLEGDGGGHVGDYKATTQRFIDGLRIASSRNENIGFH